MFTGRTQDLWLKFQIFICCRILDLMFVRDGFECDGSHFIIQLTLKWFYLLRLVYTVRFFLIATAIPQWKCSHCATATTSPAPKPIVSKNKLLLQIAQCEWIPTDHDGEGNVFTGVCLSTSRWVPFQPGRCGSHPTRTTPPCYSHPEGPEEGPVRKEALTPSILLSSPHQKAG